MNVVHLTASTFHGGPERQMLGLARHLPAEVRSVFLSFREGDRCRPFLSAARQQGLEAIGLEKDTPHLFAAVREIAGHLASVEADVLLCHGYKANLLGRRAARQRGIPAVAVSRGWTGESFRVRLYERLDRFHLRFMDRVVCVSEAQARKVRATGAKRVRVIHNAVDPGRFAAPDPRQRTKLARHFRTPKTRIIGAAGRLSPEKGFGVLVAAAERLLRDDPSLGFLLFGDGACRAELLQQINEAGLGGSFVLTGFRPDLDRFIPHLDLMVLPSFTEGLPNVLLEAFAGGVPVVATAVGGTPELVEDGASGYLVPPRDDAKLAEGIAKALASEEHLRELGARGRQRVEEDFSFRAQVARYLALFEELCGPLERLPKPEAVSNEEVTVPDAEPAVLLPLEPTCER